MGARESIQRLISKKEQEIEEIEEKQRSLEITLREAQAYIQALQDSMKLLPREGISEAIPIELRPGSALARTRDLLKQGGRPLHVSDILKLLGKPNDKKNRVSLSGTLAGYARTGKVFTKTAPNTFGLIEMSAETVAEGTIGDEADPIPETFGRVS